jgi:AraC-like DNA-binding protein
VNARAGKTPARPPRRRAALASLPLLLLPLSLAFAGDTPRADTAAFNPALIVLRARQMADSAAADTSSAPQITRITADSARIIQPQIRAVIAESSIAYEIEPLLPADSVTLFARHSQTLADTLGTFASPPFRAEWDNSALSNQDQFHLQFGYIIYASGGAVITSPATPHRHMLDRGMRPSKKKYHIRQLTAPGKFKPDCDLSKWRDVKGADAGDIARFKLAWTGARLHFIIQVRDSSVTAGDFAELHLDMKRDRAQFAGIDHRSVRFGPRSGSQSFIVELNDSGFVYSDSINSLIKDETEWQTVTTPDGYIIEAAIPFALLFGIGFPPARIGFDVSVMNVDRVAARAEVDADADASGAGVAGAVFGKAENVSSFYSWSGAERFARYSPRGWGTARISQAALAIKATLIFVLIAVCAAPLFFILQMIASKRAKNQYDPGDGVVSSPLTDKVIERVEEKLADAGFGLADVLKSAGASEAEVSAAIRKDLDCTFEQLLAFRRIKRSQGLMRNPDIGIEEIAKMCGFASADNYKEMYVAQMNIDPEVGRAALLAKLKEEEEAEEDEDDEDD